MKIAIDLGTTSLAGRILDDAGRVVAEIQLPNPQGEFGADVLRRLEAARNGKGAALQAALVRGMNELTAELLQQAGGAPDSISAAAAAANPAVSILLQNLSPDPILFPPYRPDSRSAVLIAPDEIGLQLPVPLYLFPLVNGFVGGDLVAFLYGEPAPPATTLYVDIGTNAELALYADDRWRVTSVAAGPAFEGGEIGSGMIYGPGAITGCRIENDRFAYTVVDGESPHGICGSGLMEIIAASVEEGLVDRRGRIVSGDEVATNLARSIISGPEGQALLLYRDASRRIVLEQKDIRNFQLAKAAVRAGVECLLEKSGIASDAITGVVLTGAFGLSLSKSSLKKVAMLPENMIDKVRFKPGGALEGICRMLQLEDGPGEVDNLARRLKPYPLSGTPAFEKAFIAAIDF